MAPNGNHGWEKMVRDDKGIGEMVDDGERWDGARRKMVEGGERDGEEMVVNGKK